MRPAQRLAAGGAGWPPPLDPGPGVAGAPGAPEGRRSVSVRFAVLLRPLGRRSDSLIVARPAASRRVATAWRSKRSLTPVTERLGSRTVRVATVRPAAVAFAVPRSA